VRSDGKGSQSPGSDYPDPDLVLAAAPDLAVLDVLLRSGDGFELARELRAARDLPIVFLTARDTVEDRLDGFELGADDYLVKPFALEELLARVRAVLRRTGRLGETDGLPPLGHPGCQR
jgi:DNA-binding response OmpR family regulator